MINLHTVKQWFVVYEEGNKDYFFDAPPVVYQERAPEVPEEDQRASVLSFVLGLGAKMGQMTSEKVATFVMTKNVDNDNAWAPENILQPNKQPTNDIFG